MQIFLLQWNWRHSLSTKRKSCQSKLIHHVTITTDTDIITQNDESVMRLITSKNQFGNLMARFFFETRTIFFTALWEIWRVLNLQENTWKMILWGQTLKRSAVTSRARTTLPCAGTLISHLELRFWGQIYCRRHIQSKFPGLLRAGWNLAMAHEVCYLRRKR